ncbi:NAD(P)-dependent oxidoreductase [uncultured Desulfovibrio sp.]|uniref:NAD(P)-dependent oxidoreductase n=1 Tax=uncultured Desulfovibrio sp. TaxID=167968 RepID=UPI00260DE8A3|nr:NAD(P)-dependent oxidoreductase [uncultured Desulfovibrio sp.]
MEFGFIGVGAMGGPLARNLIRAGKTVHVYNRSAEGRDKTLAAGKSGVPAMSMADMAPCKVVFTCLALPEHLTEKALGTDGLYAHMQPGSVHVELSTIDSHTAFALAEAADRQGIAYIQCTLGKTPAHAERGEAPLFVGGDQQAIAGLAEVWPILGVFNNVGTVEAACAVKLVSNLVGMANLAVLSEGLRIGEAAGVEKNLLLQLLGETGAQSFQLDTRGKSMAQGEYDPPRFALELALKDLRLGCGMAHGMNVDVPLLDMVFARFGRGEAAGLGKKDCAAVHEV